MKKINTIHLKKALTSIFDLKNDSNKVPKKHRLKLLWSSLHKFNHRLVDISKRLSLVLSFLIFILSSKAQAIYTEFGISQSYKKTSFSTDNYVESEMLSGSVSFYIWEQVALEFSYTKGLAVRKETEVNYPIKTITQYSSVYGTDLILGFADRQSTFQPFIKGGAAYIEKRQVTQDAGNQPSQYNPKPGYVPSYGVGLKIKLTQNFGLSTSLDVWKDDSMSTNDLASRTGITWMF